MFKNRKSGSSKNSRTKLSKKLISVTAMTMAAVFIFQSASVSDGVGMGNLVFPVTKDYSNGNQDLDLHNLYEYFFDDIDSFNFKKLSKKKGGSFLNNKAPTKYAKYYTNPYYPGSGRWLNSKYGKKYLKKISDARKNNKYTTLIKYDMRLGEWAYICKYGTKTKLHMSKYSITDPYFGNGELCQEVNLGDRYPEFYDGNSCLTIPELKQLKKKGYLKKSLYYGAEHPKDITINVGDTVTNKPENMPKNNLYNKDTSYGIDQTWDAYTPENLLKAKKNRPITLQWIMVGNGTITQLIGQDIKTHQVQNAGYDFSNVKAGSDVVKVDSNTGKITGMKKGTAYVTINYKEYVATNGIEYDILQASKIKDKNLRDKEYEKIKNSDEFLHSQAIRQNSYLEDMNIGEDAFIRIKFYRTFKVTVK